MIDAIYRRRAEQLARPIAVDAADRVPVLIVTLGAIDFGVQVSALAEVLPYRGCTPVNGEPAALIGVLNVRGDIRSVVDLARLLDVPAGGGEHGYIVMTRTRDGFVALRVDTVGDIRYIEASRLNASADRPARFIKVMLDGDRESGGMVRVVDVDVVLAALGVAD
ncbi:MAG TPA: chemotaxis protein CheW [Vicinamibacterales bacterium]|nr:chemotaxis protein CheW [Vicinamibacterales bacterium]